MLSAWNAPQEIVDKVIGFCASLSQSCRRLLRGRSGDTWCRYWITRVRAIIAGRERRTRICSPASAVASVCSSSSSLPAATCSAPSAWTHRYLLYACATSDTELTPPRETTAASVRRLSTGTSCSCCSPGSRARNTSSKPRNRRCGTRSDAARWTKWMSRSVPRKKHSQQSISPPNPNTLSNR